MIRLNPTRLELRIEDLNEFSEIKNEFEAFKKAKDEKQRNLLGTNVPTNSKTKQEAVQERIGFVPRPRHSSQ
ncbi:anaphase-promoting complex subunit CDC26-like [Sipha flava]|jgi:hypothetical protein|uniref:Anaphase-promoting complex subunit CDC26 n=1 Tax=Sipha flava TaxID=143950 RepID=A0A8B8GB50_9HEMI|nr:anaphase-promoting complex subunit CDC26-like [Sipha flava]